mmetsp:Transcript_34953/g.81005  ORF Transcript_34953/g.81005 Transcript_34953/m.81005 type:complete len:89 (-) Transcript_34953:205-471(-)
MCVYMSGLRDDQVDGGSSVGCALWWCRCRLSFFVFTFTGLFRRPVDAITLFAFGGGGERQGLEVGAAIHGVWPMRLVQRVIASHAGAG